MATDPKPTPAETALADIIKAAKDLDVAPEVTVDNAAEVFAQVVRQHVRLNLQNTQLKALLKGML